MSPDNFKKILDLDGSAPEPVIWSGDTGQQIRCFDSCQLITTLMCNIGAISVFLCSQCEIEHWFACGADGRGWVDFLTHGAPQARFARQSSAIKVKWFGILLMFI